MIKGLSQPKVNCPDCNLPCAWHRVEVHRNGNFCWGDDLKIQTDDDFALYKYWKYKKNNHVGKGKSEVKFLIGPTEMISLLEEAGISINDVGNGKGKYNLARHGDKGNYEYGNCRFVLQIDNLTEREYSLRYIVNGVTYDNTKDVAEKMNCGRATVRRRCESLKFPDWKLIEL